MFVKKSGHRRTHGKPRNNNNNNNLAHVECKSKNGTGNIRGECSHFKITQKIPEHHTKKERNYGAKK
jgi:hypothetical protein